MTFISEYCLELPANFPGNDLSQFIAAARRVLLTPEISPAWTEFAGASNLIGWRFRTSLEEWVTYKTSLTTYGDSASHEELYKRERALFGMFTAGVSCIESTTYSLAALASHPNVLSLPFGVTEQRNCSPRNLLNGLSARPPKGQELAMVLRMLVNSPEWSLWVDLRNRMTHRSNLPRVIVASLGAPPPLTSPINFAPTTSTPRVEAEISDFGRLHIWLTEVLSALLIQGTTLANTP